MPSSAGPDPEAPLPFSPRTYPYVSCPPHFPPPPGPDPAPFHRVGPGLLHRLQLPLQEARRLQAPGLLLDLCRSLRLPSA